MASDLRASVAGATNPMDPVAIAMAAINAKKAEDEEDKKKDEAAKKAEDDKKKDEEAKRKAEEDEKKKKDEEAKRKAEEDEKKKKDEEAKKAAEDEKKKKDAEKDDDDGDKAANRDPLLTSARASERGRIQAILTCAGAASVPKFASHMAFKTSTPRIEAISAIDAYAADRPEGSPGRQSLSQRMESAPRPNVGLDGGTSPSATKALADAIVLAGMKRRGEVNGDGTPIKK